MNRFVALGFAFALLVMVPGCGGGADGTIKQFIADMNALSESIEKKESPEKIKAAAERFKATGEKMKDMKMSKDEDERLKKKYEAELKSGMERMMKAMMSNPEAAKSAGNAIK